MDRSAYLNVSDESDGFDVFDACSSLSERSAASVESFFSQAVGNNAKEKYK